MASAKETPRQKLINLMYLVFIVMLALNVSKEVLDGFGQMYAKLKLTNTHVAEGNQTYYDKVKINAAEKKGSWIDHSQTAARIKKASDDFYDKIENIKLRITEKQRKRDPELKDYERMDRGDELNAIFFSPEGLSREGKAFLNMIVDYKNEITQGFGGQFLSLKPLVEERFYTGDEKFNVKNRDNRKQNWLEYNFEGFPMISSLAKLTMMQNDIRSTENDVLKTLLGGELETETEVNEMNYITLLKMEKGAYYAGETFDGSILLGRRGGTQHPNGVDIRLDGKKITKNEYELIPGGIKLKVKTGSQGDHTLEGDLVFLDESKENRISVNQTFSVISQPNAAVISADKMNVVYRGVENPMTISIPGIPDNKVVASGIGLKRVSGSRYVMNPSRGREVTIDAKGILPDGKEVSTSTKFRIKDIPRPTGTVRGESGNITIPKANLEIATIGAVLDDFDFDINLRTISFKFKVPGLPTIEVRGNKLDARAKSALKRAKAGQSIQIFDIKVQNPKNRSYRFKKVSPVICEIVN